MSDYCMLKIAFDNLEEVKKITEKLLDEKLVASCQVYEANSSWNWHNNRENAREYILQMPTKKNLQEKIYEIVKAIHSYECFEFASLELTSINKEYLEWIDNETVSE